MECASTDAHALPHPLRNRVLHADPAALQACRGVSQPLVEQEQQEKWRQGVWPSAQVERIADLLQDGDQLNVVAVGRDQRGNLRLSRKPLLGTAHDQIVRKQG